jgi:hypothetical protein
MLQEGLLVSYWYERRSALLVYTDWKYEAFRVARSEQVHRTRAFRTGSSDSSFTKKPCACASIAILSDITS